jgi:S-disulfanyl-L-cysteine oxidoreductase SoxD
VPQKTTYVQSVYFIIREKLRMSTIPSLFAVAAAALLMVVPVGAKADPAAGQQAFRQCQACHMVGDDAASRVGPHLNDLFGRVAGTLEGFRFSPALVTAGEEGLIWDDETIDAFLADPRGFLPGNRMAYPGMRDADQRTSLIAYLATYSDLSDDGVPDE